MNHIQRSLMSNAHTSSFSRRSLVRSTTFAALGLVATNRPGTAASFQGETSMFATNQEATPEVQFVPAPEGKTDLIVAAGADMTSPDPAMATGGTDASMHSILFDNLVQIDADGVEQPMLATEWTAIDDITWEFILRSGALFQDGTPVLSSDVKYSIERTRAPETTGSVVATNFNTVEEILTPDDATVHFRTVGPDPLLPKRLASFGGEIIPQAYAEEVGLDGFAEAPIGAGPFILAEWLPDERIVLSPFQDYWDGAPNVSEVTILPRPESATRIGSLLSGESDIALVVMPDQYETINTTDGYRVGTHLYAGLYALAVNSQVPVLSDPLIKQAIAYAIDRDVIINSLWNGQGLAPSGMIPRGSFAFDESLPPIPYDPDRVAQLLEEASYGGEEIIIESTDGYIENDRLMSEAIAQMWQQVGINGMVEIIEISVRAEKNRDKTFQGLFWTNPADTLLDPAGMAWRLLGPGGAQDYWRNERWDELGAEANSSLDEDLRRANYAEMNAIFLEHFPWIPILQPYRGAGIANYVDWQPYQKFDLRPDELALVE